MTTKLMGTLSLIKHGNQSLNIKCRDVTRGKKFLLLKY